MTWRSIAGKKWRCISKMLCRIYIAIVRAMLTHGTVTCVDRTERSATARELHKLKRLTYKSIRQRKFANTVPIGTHGDEIIFIFTFKRAIFRRFGTTSEAGSCLKQRKIDIFFRPHPELLILRDNMTWSIRANWGSMTYDLNQY